MAEYVLEYVEFGVPDPSIRVLLHTLKIDGWRVIG